MAAGEACLNHNTKSNSCILFYLFLMNGRSFILEIRRWRLSLSTGLTSMTPVRITCFIIMSCREPFYQVSITSKQKIPVTFILEPLTNGHAKLNHRCRSMIWWIISRGMVSFCCFLLIYSTMSVLITLSVIVLIWLLMLNSPRRRLNAKRSHEQFSTPL